MSIDPRTIYNFHTDPGHGWLEVPLPELRELGIHNHISRFSYIDRNRGCAYLEEDCDATRFGEAFQQRFGHWPNHSEVYCEDTPIRNYERYPS
jgi:hypothetical protein